MIGYEAFSDKMVMVLCENFLYIGEKNYSGVAQELVKSYSGVSLE